MAKYIPVGINLTQSQIEKLRHGKQHDKSVTLQLERSQLGGQHELHLTQRQVNKLKGMKSASVRITLSRSQMKYQRGGFLGAIAKVALPFLKNTLPKLAKTVIPTLGLSALSGLVSGSVDKKVSGRGVVVKIPEKDAMLMFKTCSDCERHGIIPKGSTEQAIREVKEQKGGFLGTLIASLAGSLLPTLLGGKGLYRSGVLQPKGNGLFRAGVKHPKGRGLYRVGKSVSKKKASF